MRNAPIVHGVPTPFAMHNHPYPTRFRGPVYTRAVFGHPVIARPQQVFTPGYDLDAHLPQPALSGLGTAEETRLWSTGDGIFKPGGYGGGVFDGNISGLGSIGARTTSKRGRFSLRGLGADDSATYPWKEKSAATETLQQQTNVSLAKAGMCPITVDGKLGGGTCGARNFLTANSEKLLGQEMLFSNPSACADHAAELVRPRSKAEGCGGGSSPVGPAMPLPATSLESGMSSSTKRTLGFALGGVLALGAVVMMRRSR